MSFFYPEFSIKEKPYTKHPWEHWIKDRHTATYKYAHNSIENPIYPVPKAEIPEGKRVRFIVIGNRVTKGFIYCQHLVKGLYKYRKKQFEAPIIRGVTSVEWPKVWNDLKIQFGVAAFCIKSQVAVLLDNAFLGGEEELKDLIESKYVYHYPEYVDYNKEGIQQFSNYVKSMGRPCAYLHICINEVPIGTLIFVLYSDILPYTCQNFIRLCDSQRGGYAGTPIHRIVKDGWIQCGGFGLKNNASLDCENYTVPHDRRGVLCMANDGRNKDCSTQFFILLQPANWMKYKYVAFGQLIEGKRTLQIIENVPTWYESPTDRIIIYRTGVFNMECLWRPINKTAHDYISGHIEDLVQLGTLFYEALLEKVYAALDEKIPEEKEPEIKDVRPTKRFLRSKQGTKSTASEVNNEFDVEEYMEGEGEEEGSSQRDSCYLADETPKSSKILERPYYLPLTDVPYPGEIESAFNLQRLLRGDYCLEADLIKDREERIKNFKEHTGLNIPEELLDVLFECFDADDEKSESSLDSDDETRIRLYINKNVDSASFAGPVVKKMAHTHEKYELFESADDTQKKAFLTDENLRLFRVAAKEIKSRHHKKVSISSSTAMASHTRIQRRQTGYVRKEELNELEDILDRIKEDEDVMKESDPTDRTRSVQVVSNKSEGKGAISRRQTGYVRPADMSQRVSVLQRLYHEVSNQDLDDEPPTLKNYKTISETNQRDNYHYLTHSPLSLHENSRERLYVPRFSVDVPRFSVDVPPLEDSLNLQHGKKLSRKVSSDYANTLTRFEHPPNSSLRSIEFAKQRPSMTVVEYKRKNQQYEEENKEKMGQATT